MKVQGSKGGKYIGNSKSLVYDFFFTNPFYSPYNQSLFIPALRMNHKSKALFLISDRGNLSL